MKKLKIDQKFLPRKAQEKQKLIVNFSANGKGKKLKNFLPRIITD